MLYYYLIIVLQTVWLHTWLVDYSCSSKRPKIPQINLCTFLKIRKIDPCFIQGCIYIYFCCKGNWWKSPRWQYYLVLGGRWSSEPRPHCRHSSPLAHQAPHQPTVHWQILWFHKTWGFPSGRETQDEVFLSLASPRLCSDFVVLS